MKKLNFVCVIDRFDYLSGMNHSFHSLASILHDLGENVYSIGIGKPGFKYKIFNIENFNPEINVLPEINKLDLKLNGLDSSNTIFISPLFNLPFMESLKQIKWMEFYDDNYEFNDDYLYFYNTLGFCRSGRKYDGALRFFDIDLDFWHPTTKQKSRNSYLVKKLSRYMSKEDLNDHIMKNLLRFQSLSPKFPILNIDNIAGLLDYKNDTYEKVRPMQRDIWSESDFFISFDTITAQTMFATLCGSKSIVIPENNKYQPEEYRELFYPYMSCGIAYGLDDLSHMYKTAPKIREHCETAYQNYIDDVKKLVKICEEKF